MRKIFIASTVFTACFHTTPSSDSSDGGSSSSSSSSEGETGTGMTSDTDDTGGTSGSSGSSDESDSGSMPDMLDIEDDCGFFEGWEEWAGWDSEWNTESGDEPWSYQTWMPYDGEGHSGSEVIPGGVYANSILQRTFYVSEPATVIFWTLAWVDSNDFLEVRVDGGLVLSVGHTGQTYIQQSFDLPDGSSNVEFAFERKPGGGDGLSNVLLDSVEITCGG